MNLLFIASGRRYSLLEQFRNNINIDDRIVCTDTTKYVPTKLLADKFYVINSFDNETEFIQDIKNIIKFESIDAIVSLMDPGTKILCNHIDSLKALLLCTSKTVNNISSNKTNTSLFFSGLDVPTPKLITTCTIKKYLKNSTVVIRPNSGYGSRKIEFVSSLEEFNLFKKKNNYNNKYIDNNFCMTQFKEGHEVTIDCFKDTENNIIAVIPRKRLEVRGGEVQKAEIFKSTKIDHFLRNFILPNLPFSGSICIQAIVDNNNIPYFTEINDRFGGGTPICFYAGADFTKFTVDMIKGIKLHILKDFNTGIALRADREFFIKNDMEL